MSIAIFDLKVLYRKEKISNTDGCQTISQINYSTFTPLHPIIFYELRKQRQPRRQTLLIILQIIAYWSIVICIRYCEMQYIIRRDACWKKSLMAQHVYNTSYNIQMFCQLKITTLIIFILNNFQMKQHPILGIEKQMFYNA